MKPSNKFTEQTRKTVLSLLKKHGTQNSINSLIEFEGSIVGMLCRRAKSIGLNEQFDLIWGDSDDDKPNWGSEDEIRLFIDGMFSLHNVSNSSMRSTRYKPTILKDRKDYKLWCQSFIKGLGKSFLIEDADAPEFAMAILIIMILAEYSAVNTTYLNNNAEFQDFHQKVQELPLMKFADAVRNIYKYYHEDVFKQEEKQAYPKRNDPCVCGSGKKFKHCCLH